MKKLLGLSLLAALALCPLHHAAASDYPNKPVTVIIPFSPGGGGDIAVRVIEKDFAEEFGQPLSFVYKPGANGAIGYSAIAAERPDGYTIAAVSYPHLLMNKLQGSGQYELDQFDLICMPVRDDSFLVTSKESGITSLAQLAEKAKANPNKLTLGAVESLGPSHIPALLLKKAGIPFNIVTFNGGPKAVPALLGGHIQALFATKGTAMSSASKLNILAVAANERDPNLPDVPTLKELGYDITGFIGRGFAAPKGLPADVKARLEEGFKRIYSKPGIAERYAPNGMSVIWVDGAQFRQMFNDFQPQADQAMQLNKEING